MHYHVGDGVGGFGLAGNSRDLVRLIDHKESSPGRGEMRTRRRKGRLQCTQGKMKKRLRKESLFDKRREMMKRMRKQTPKQRRKKKTT